MKDVRSKGNNERKMYTKITPLYPIFYVFYDLERFRGLSYILQPFLSLEINSKTSLEG